MTPKYNIYNKSYLLFIAFLQLISILTGFSQNVTKHSHDEIVSGNPVIDSIFSTINHFNLQEMAIDRANQNSNKANLHTFLENRFPDLNFMFLKFYQNNSETAITVYQNWLLKEYTNSFIYYTPKNNLRIKTTTSCDNVDFENGDFSSWNGVYGRACIDSTDKLNRISYVCNTTNGFSGANTKKSYINQHVITNKTMTDMYIPTLPVVYPGKGNYSIRLGNYMDSTGAAKISKTFLVTPDNNVFTYHYACVLEEPSGDHLDYERPYFRVRLYDENGLEIKCADYKAIARAPITNFTYYPTPDPYLSNQTLELYYRNWTDVSIPLFKYVGKNITVEFTASDCSRKGHFGYAYIDADCGSIIPTQIKTCEDAVDSLETPLGFSKYVWTGPGIIGNNTSNKIKINKAGIYKVAVSPVSDLPCPDTLYYSVLEKCYPAPVKIDLCETTNGTLKTENVDLKNFIKLVTAYKNPHGKLLNWFSGMPAANNILTNSSNITIQNGDSLNATVFISNTREDTVLVKFTVKPAQKVAFPPISHLCENGASIQLNATPLGGIYSGEMVSTSGLLNPQKSDTISVKYVYSTTGGGCKDSLSQEIIILPKPTVNSGIDQTVCETDSIITLNGLASKQKSVQWTGGNGLFENNINSATKYHLNKSDITNKSIKLILTATATAPCIAVNDTLNIKIIYKPTVDAGANQSICETNSSIVLNGTSTNQSTTVWSGGLGTFANKNTISTAYTPTSAEKNGASFKLYLTANALNPCKNITDSVEILLATQPTINAGIDQTVCESDTIIALNGLASKQKSVLWNGGNGIFENKISSITKYHLSKVDIISQNIKLILTANATAPCVVVKDTVNIEIINNPKVDAGLNQTICETNGSIILNGSSTNQSSTVWSGGLGSFSNTNSTSTIYTPVQTEKNGTSFKLYLTANSFNPCENITDSMFVKIVKIPTLDISQNIKICSNQDSIFIIPNSVQSQSFSYKKSSANALVYVDSTNQTFIYKPSIEERQLGKSSLIVTTINNKPCPEVSDSINFTYFGSPSIDLPPYFKFCSDSTAGINIISKHLPVSYLWKPNNETSESILANAPGIYTLIISDTNNCKANAKTLVREVCPPRLFPPTAFSPDGDYTNDYFIIHGAHIGNYRLLIYNRWGEVIFESLNINNSWNGQYHGELMPIGVYPWTLIYEGDSEEYKGPYQRKGSVTIVK